MHAKAWAQSDQQQNQLGKGGDGQDGHGQCVKMVKVSEGVG